MTQRSPDFGLGPGPNRSGGRWRPAGRVATAALAAILLVLAVVVVAWLIASSDDPAPHSSGGPPTSTLIDETRSSASDLPTIAPTSISNTVPPTFTSQSAVADPVAAYRQRCLQATSELDVASVRFDASVSLDVGDQHRFQVTLTSPDLPSPTSSLAPERGRVEVACVVEARLVTSGGAVVVSPQDWSRDQYVPPDPTTWTWVVSAEEPGTSAAVLELRPAIRVGPGRSTPASEQELGTVEYDVTFEVSSSVGDKAGAVGTWLLAVGSTIGGIITAVASYLTIRNHRRRTQVADAPPAQAPTSTGSSATQPGATSAGGTGGRSATTRAKRPRSSGRNPP